MRSALNAQAAFTYWGVRLNAARTVTGVRFLEPDDSGRPRPHFRGGGQVLVASPRPQLRRLQEAHPGHIAPARRPLSAEGPPSWGASIRRAVSARVKPVVGSVLTLNLFRNIPPAPEYLASTKIKPLLLGLYPSSPLPTPSL